MNRRCHSVYLDEDACKGCTICVTTCPTEAIRVRDGKARIIEERCIDCGECIRRCPHHAKKARSDDPSMLAPADSAAAADSERSALYELKIAIPAPSLYGQFPVKYSINEIHRALIDCGFDMVYPVAAATGGIAGASAAFLDRARYPDLPRPLISSSCPTIIKFIQIRFPSLIENIVPVIAPMELAARMARAEAKRLFPNRPKAGVFFISPCAGKITEAKSPLGDETSSVDGVFSMADFHLPMLAALQKAGEGDGAPQPLSLYPEDIAWSRAGGEAEDTGAEKGTATLAVDGMDQCVKILEAVEDGKLDSVDFLELMACASGCVGGPLAALTPALGKHIVSEREKELAARPEKTEQTLVVRRELLAEAAAITDVRSKTDERSATARQEGTKTAEPASETARNAEAARARRLDCERCLRTERFPPRPALQLDSDYRRAVELMEKMEEIRAELPGLDCGCCGAPNCRALAEDIVKGLARKTDCVIILKEQYRKLLERRGGEDA